MELIAYILLGTYAFACLVLLIVWNFSFEKMTLSGFAEKPFVSIIIPVRNEANNILNLLQSIENQGYSKLFFEVILVNDASEDNTVSVVEQFESTSELSIHMLNLSERKDNASPKKRAITEAIKTAKGELVITTDGDCTMGENWLETVVDFYLKTDAFFISSPVSFYSLENGNVLQKIWNNFQVIEFGSLVGAGASSIKMSNPNMCSGANIAYKKSVFEEVGGYSGNEQIASGDDEFLMQKIATRFPDKIQFLKDYDAVVQTQSHETISSFFVQRKRWASKWRFYKNWQPTALAIYVAIVNGITAFALITARFDLVLLKFSVEFLFLASVVLFFKKPKAIFYIPFTQLIYPFYVCIMAIAAQGKGDYVWKGRKLK
ncbi:MAG: glycosyltransferase [Spirosomaceae bacterium]|nr:glycosyltransferase [Spirosomataceae bacterium]